VSVDLSRAVLADFSRQGVRKIKKPEKAKGSHGGCLLALTVAADFTENPASRPNWPAARDRRNAFRRLD
jgi:hypothetical protein